LFFDEIVPIKKFDQRAERNEKQRSGAVQTVRSGTNGQGTVTVGQGTVKERTRNGKERARNGKRTGKEQ